MVGVYPRKTPGSAHSVNDIKDVEATSKKINNKSEEWNGNSLVFIYIFASRDQSPATSNVGLLTEI